LDAVGTFSVEREALLETISRVARSASRDESRPVLTGILVRFEPGKLVMAATDSYRLASKETPLSGESPELEAIIPARALGELQRIATSGDTVELGVHENQVIIGSSGVWLTSRRIDGQFPNIGQLVPDTFEHDLTVPRAEPLEIGFNAEFLRDGLESIDTEEVRFRLISPLRPAVLQTAESDFTYLIMPIRLAG
jgi:DNA polymerase-3 subunit beta